MPSHLLRAGAVAAIVALATCATTSSAYAAGQLSQEDWNAFSYATALYAMQQAPPTLIFEPGQRVSLPSWDVATPSVIGTFVSMELNQAGTICFNCVNGHEAGTFGMGDPLGYINSTNTHLGLLFVYFDVSHTGACTLAIALTQGTTTLASGSGSFSPIPGAVETAKLQITRQSTWHGAALMVGKIVCGTTTAMSKGTVYFQ